MRFSSNYASVPTVTSKGTETKRDSSCVMIFVLNSIALFDVFQKFEEERNLLQSKKHLYDNNNAQKDFSKNININRTTTVSLK